MTAMHRILLLLIFMIVSSGSASAFDPEGATVELTDVGGLRGFALGVFGVDTSRSYRPVEDNQLQIKTAALEFSWSRGGFLIEVSAGRTSYSEFTLLSQSEWSANFAGVRLRQEIGTVAGGVWAAGFSGYQYGVEGDSWRELNFSLRWSRRF